MDLKELKNKRINRILINQEKDILLLYLYEKSNFNQCLYYMTFTGDCCAKCFIAEVNGYTNYTDILDVEVSEWIEITNQEDRDRCDVKETMGIKIKTSKGYLDISTRVEHSGYYGGYVNLSNNFPLDQYGHPVDFIDQKFEELKDF